MLAVIAFQLIVMIVYVAYAFLWAHRAQVELRRSHRNLHWLLFGMLLSSIMIIIR